MDNCVAPAPAPAAAAASVTPVLLDHKPRNWTLFRVVIQHLNKFAAFEFNRFFK